MQKLASFSDDIAIKANCDQNRTSFSNPYRYTITKGRDLVGGTDDSKKVFFKVIDIECFEVEFTDAASSPTPINPPLKPANYDVSFMSDIIQETDKKSLIDVLFGQIKKEFTLERVYSGKTDGYNPNVLHMKTDNVGNRVFIIKNEWDTVFGGYITVPLNTVSVTWIDDPKAFIYQFSPETKVFPTNTDNGMFYALSSFSNIKVFIIYTKVSMLSQKIYKN